MIQLVCRAASVISGRDNSRLRIHKNVTIAIWGHFHANGANVTARVPGRPSMFIICLIALEQMREQTVIRENDGLLQILQRRRLERFPGNVIVTTQRAGLSTRALHFHKMPLDTGSCIVTVVVQIAAIESELLRFIEIERREINSASINSRVGGVMNLKALESSNFFHIRHRTRSAQRVSVWRIVKSAPLGEGGE